jgi:hypothetical protein
MSTTKVRELSAADSARIKCQMLDQKLNHCGKPAVVVHQVEWDTGNTTGISFFYHCEEHREVKRR